MARRAVFPFTAIVGQSKMKRALILNAVSPRIGGVLLRGERGTAKSTAARALAALLPDIEIINGSRFNSDPNRPNEWSDECVSKFSDGNYEVKVRRTPFIDLPVSATEDRVVGTLDIEKAIQSGEKHFEPGVLASANRGILYVDEVNLLDDHVVDLLLDSAAMGINIVEREGISFTHPAKFVLIGSMNPEEGDLRPQLLDRFAFSVNIGGLLETRQRVEIMERRLAFEVEPDEFYEEWQDRERELSQRIANARKIVNDVHHTRRDLLKIATLTSHFKVDGHRGDLVILRGAQAHAAYFGRTHITDEDISLAAELALPHRIKGRLFEDTSVSAEQLQNSLRQMNDTVDSDDADQMQQQDTDAPQGDEKKKPWTWTQK